MKNSLFCAASLLTLLSVSHAENIVYPSDSGVLNVKSAEFGAKGDGTTDDTAAIQKALSAALSKHRLVYLPDGTYRVSDTLKWNNGDPASANGGWAPFAQLQGQSRAKTILKLADDAAGFGDVAAPKAVIQTGSSAGHGNKKYKNGEGNEAFENHIRNLSVDTGKHAGAVGIDYQVSNCGAPAARCATFPSKALEPSVCSWNGATTGRDCSKTCPSKVSIGASAPDRTFAR